MGRWIRWGLLTLLLIAVAAGLASAVLRGGTKELVRRPGVLLRLVVREEGLLWLEAPAESRARGTEPRGESVRRLLSLARGAASPTVLIEAPGIADFSLGDAVYYVTGDSLARIPLTGGSPTIVRTGLQHPTAILAGGDWICWTETRPAPAFSLPVLPLTRPATLLRALPRAGGEPLTVSTTDGDGSMALQLLSLTDNTLYWAEHRSDLHPATLFKRVSLTRDPSGGLSPPETLGAEEGIHDGVLTGGNFYWTGGSREGAPAGAFASVNVRPYARDAGDVKLLGDWLPPEGVLRVDGSRAYYCGQGIYEMPGNAGVPRKILGLDGAGVHTQILHDNAYVIESEAGQGYRIVRRPLHAGGRWAARRGAVP
jgi:hypothetical protein